ncbi:MAG: hypothetical protein ACYC5M_15570 [Anaerolineae bacterium]
MDKWLALYVSASPEMDAECELLGQLLAEMPATIRWIIRRTPKPQEVTQPDIEGLRASHFYVILLGMDLMAPVGVEWMAAQAVGLPSFAYHNVSVPPSPATAHFVRNAGIPWQHYETPAEFARHLEKALIERLIQGTPGYGLDLPDIEELSRRLAGLEDKAESSSAGDRRGSEDRRGAGHGGVILSSRR